MSNQKRRVASIAIVQASQRIPVGQLLEKTTLELKRMEEKEVIESVDEQSEWCFQ